MADTPGLPPVMVVRDMLQDLLGRDVDLAPSEPWAPTVRDIGAVAVYVNDSTRLQALISCNLELAVALAASIALIPAKTAASIVQERQLPSDMVDNLFEVLNVLAALFNRKNAPHVRLFELFAPGDPPSADISDQLRRLGQRADVTVKVSGYGSGLLSIVLA